MTRGNSLKKTVLNEILPRVSKPGQYAAGERNIVVKDHSSVDLTFALAFPDTYAVGMSHLGLKILYHMLNAREDVAAERVFAPWLDMEEELRKRQLPLFSLETFTPLCDFDVVGFSMQYELCYTNVLNMLELGGVPVRTSDRERSDPVVLAGGSITAALEPMAPFFDAVLVGDAEDVLDAIVDTIIQWKKSHLPRHALHERLVKLPGMYIPSLYHVTYRGDGAIEKIERTSPAPPKVFKTTTADLENAPFPIRPVVPNVEVVHDRINVEIMRGCPNQCRFCQAMHHYRPLRRRSIEKILSLCEDIYDHTGYEEISLVSLSTADYPGIAELIASVAARFHERRVNVSLPSLKVGELLKILPGLASTIRKAGLTMAPEVATDRLREVVRKPMKNSDLLNGCDAAYRAGYRLLKLYFLIGCPTETDEDLKAIIKLVDEASLLRKRMYRKRGQINVSISSHVPKPHTPFQWERMSSREELRAKQAYIRSRKTSSCLHLKFHDVDASYLEAVFSRGDRRLADVLLRARERGIRMDAWSECFDMGTWGEVFEDARIDPDFYALREWKTDELLPWDMIALEIPTAHLMRERERAYAAAEIG